MLVKRKIVQNFILSILAAFCVFIFFDNDAAFYRTPVAVVTATKSVSQSHQTDNYGNQDIDVTQKLTVRLLNANHKNLTLTNTAYKSQVTGQIYRVGQKILLSSDNAQAQILGMKRDAIIAALLTLFIGLLLSFVDLQSASFLLLSLLLNLGFFIATLMLDIQGLAPFLIFGGLSLFFAAASLAFVLGRTRQMLDTFLSTLLTTALALVIALVVLGLTGNAGVHFEYMSYVTQNPEIFFFIGCMISVLGAVMDGCSDIVAGLFAIYRQNPQTSKKQLFKSGMAIGREITGTLTNVLFMIFMAETMPMTLLLLKNGNTWSYVAMIALNLGLLQTLISAIGILLAVPVTSGLVSWHLSKRAPAKEVD